MAEADDAQTTPEGDEDRHADSNDRPDWSIAETLEGRSVLVTGTTGFLGKVLASMLLRYHPDLESLHLLIRSRDGLTAEERFRDSIARSPAFDPIREIYGEAYDEFLDDKVEILDGDITAEHFGLDDERARELADELDLMVNCAGLTNFNPNLENALAINALSQRHFLNFARLAESSPRYLHVSTAFVAGQGDGLVPEQLPGPTRYPRHDELGAELDAEREIEDCQALIEHAKTLAEDQERQSQFEAEARDYLRSKNLPLDDDELFDESYEYVRDKWLRDHLSDRGLERAEHWGWPNIYTYTKSLGERLLADADDVDVAIARPAIVESSQSYPESGWIEGVNTSGPLCYLMYKGHRWIPTRETMSVDIVPVDDVSGDLIAISGALLEGRHESVYQIGSSDLNPIKGPRLVELSQLGNRRVVDDMPQLSAPQKLFIKTADSMPVTPETFQRASAPQIRRAAEGLDGLLEQVPTDSLGGFGDAVESLRTSVNSAKKTALTAEKFIELFLPFIAEFDYTFESQNIVELTETLPAAERDRYGPAIADLDWRDYWVNTHIPALAEHIYPKLDERLAASDSDVYTYDDLLELFEASTQNYADRVALQHYEDGVVERFTYDDLREGADRAARVLRDAGVRDDVGVVLASENRPQWGMAYFGILRAGGIAVPVEPDSSVDEFVNFVESSRAGVVVLSDEVADRVAEPLDEALDDEGLPVRLLRFGQLFAEALEPAESDEALPAETDWTPRPALVEAGDDEDPVASLLYTSGTTGEPKGVMLTQRNFTSLLSNLQRVFEVDPDDEFVSVLPLHHTFEFTSGFLLPMARGATVTYLDELEGEQLLGAIQSNRASAMVGVPALWELLFRRIRDQLRQTHPAIAWVADQLHSLNRTLREQFDIDIGPVAFGAIHRAFGGRLEYLVSGGAALPEEILEGFHGLGFDLYEGYGLTEAAPVLTVNQPDKGVSPGTVGRPLPDVDVKIDDPDDDGVGEVLAKGPNVMEGYLGRPEETDRALDDGWLRTGDLGRIDDDGNLEIVGRKKEVIVTPGGENVYPDELEDHYGDHDAIDALSIVGLPDDSGSERVACLVRADVDDEADPEAVREEIRDWFRVQGSRLPSHKRIQVLRFWDDDFPRTATQKIQRTEVVEILEEMLAEERESARREARAEPSDDWAWLDEAVAQLAGVSADEIHAGTHLYDDLGFDSLMFVELGSILDDREFDVDAEQLAELETVEDLRKLASSELESETSESTQATQSTALVTTEESEVDKTRRTVPGPVAEAGKSLLHRFQMAAYDKFYEVEVHGRSNIPYNDPNVLVAANHCSHLDMGLAKYALGDFGRGLRALAAEDYFFEDPLRRAYFANFTNLVPVDRSGNLEEALRYANRAIDRGETLLIFPEGTRSVTGEIQEFQDGLGYLVATRGLDVLPMYLDGTYDALPKGQNLPSPTKRRLEVHIGPRLEADRLAEDDGDGGGRSTFAAISRRTQKAVETLRDRSRGADEPVKPLFTGLNERFQPDSTEDEVSYYFTLGNVDDQKWSVVVDDDECRIEQGKPEGGVADCVVKTSPDMFRKIVEEGYVPSVDEFVAGDIKTNDPELLRDFQDFFGLGQN